MGPLSEVQLPPEVLEKYLAPVWRGEQALTSICQEKENGEQERIAEGYERLEVLTAEVDGQSTGGFQTRPYWTERRLVLRSLAQAQAAEAVLRARLTKAQNALAALNERGRGKKRFSDGESLRQAAEAVVEQRQVQGLLRLSYEEEVRERSVRRYRGRPATVRQEREVRVRVEMDEEAVEQAIRRQGWRVYVTNAAQGRLPLERVVRAYRGQHIIDRGMGRLKGWPLSLTPMYLERDDRATGPDPAADDRPAGADAAGVCPPAQPGC